MFSRPRGHPRGKGRQEVWPGKASTSGVDLNKLDFDRVETLVGALLSREWPELTKLPENVSYGEAIVSYIATLAPHDKDLLLREYLLLEVMLDEEDGPSVADAVNTFLPPLEVEPSV